MGLLALSGRVSLSRFAPMAIALPGLCVADIVVARIDRPIYGLQGAAALMKARLPRLTNRVARYGGEDFGPLLTASIGLSTWMPGTAGSAATRLNIADPDNLDTAVFHSRTARQAVQNP